jgi:two-component system LytT family response regulator
MFICKGYTVIVYHNGDQEVIDRPLFELEKQLGEQGFFRVHKSYLTNIDHVKDIIFYENGMHIKVNEHELPVSRRKKRAFQKALELRKKL